MLLYIIRHGDPDYDTDSLTNKGKQQAEALAKRLSLHGLDRVYSSPMGRARQTAKATCDLLNLPCQIEEWTREVWEDFAICQDNGEKVFCMDLPGSVYRKNIDGVDSTTWYSHPVLSGIDAKSGYEKIIRNSDAFLKKLGYEREEGLYRILWPNEEKIAVFCHGGFGLTWMAHLLQIPPHIFWAGFRVTHTGVSVFEFRNEKDGYTVPKCLCFSDMSHLYEARLPYNCCNEIDL